MDYKYIEQLLERYWECQTTLQEEQILRSFFQQADVPAHLIPYQDIFLAQKGMEEPRLGKDFDERILSLIDEQPAEQPHRISLARRLRPLYQAAGLVALLLTIGNAAQESLNHESPEAEQVQQVAEGEEAQPEDDVTALPQQQSAALEVGQSDSLQYTR